MIESTEALVARQQPETASRDGRDEGMEASKFRKLLNAFSKGGGAAEGSLQDLMAALVVEPLPVSKTAKIEKKGEVRDVEAEAHEQSVGESTERKDEDAPNEAYISSQSCVEATQVQDRPALVEKKAVVEEPAGEVAPAVVQPTCDLQPVAPEVASPELSSEEVVLAEISEDPAFTVVPGIEEAGQMRTSIVGTSNLEAETVAPSVEKIGAEGEIDLVKIQQLALPSDNQPALVINSSVDEVMHDTSKNKLANKTDVFTSELEASDRVIENLISPQDRVAVVATNENKGADEDAPTGGQTLATTSFLEAPNELPVVEGLLQLRALIERVSKEANGIGQTVAGKQAELNAVEDAGVTPMGAVKEIPTSKAVPSGVFEKSNKGLNAAKEKSTAIPERMIPKMMEKLEQVAREVERAKDGRSISLRLDPPQLGKIRVDMTMKDGSIHTRLTAESALVAHFLRERGDELQALIRKALPHLDQATIAFGESSTGNHFGQQMNFSGDSSNGFLNNRGHDGDTGFGTLSGDSEPRKGDQSRSEPTESSEHWVA
jgi:flagellar hook-length control protein FliK